MYESSITSLPLIARGKVRDIYAVGDDKLLLVTSDRLSAYDVILPTPIPGKGEILVALANFWFEKLKHIVPNQLTGIDPETVVAANEREQVRGRAIVVNKYKVLPIEAVVRCQCRDRCDQSGRDHPRSVTCPNRDLAESVGFQ